MKELQGQARIDFFEWAYHKYGLLSERDKYEPHPEDRTISELPQSAQYGLIMEWYGDIAFKPKQIEATVKKLSEIYNK